MNEWLFTGLGYLSGSIPYGLILTQLFGGVDVRTLGSGNIGATNVLRTGHKGLAVATLAFDFAKGFLPVYFSCKAGAEGNTLLSVGYAAILGHIFPVWLKFKGGKGVATALGVFWALSVPLGLFTTLSWGILTRALKISSVSALGAFTLAPVFTFFFLSSTLTIFTFTIALLIFWTHRSNIRRLVSGEEGRMNQTDE